MAFVVCGFYRVLKHVWEIEKHPRKQTSVEMDGYRKEFPQNSYNPLFEIIGMTLKVGTAVATYFVFDRLMPKNRDWKVSLATGALLYQGLIHTVGVQSTDAGVGAWLFLQAKAGFSDRGVTWMNFGKSGLGGAIFGHQFARLENLQTLDRRIDKFFRIPEFQPKST
jgi:hypothetical protein